MLRRLARLPRSASHSRHVVTVETSTGKQQLEEGNKKKEKEYISL